MTQRCRRCVPELIQIHLSLIYVYNEEGNNYNCKVKQLQTVYAMQGTRSMANQPTKGRRQQGEAHHELPSETPLC